MIVDVWLLIILFIVLVVLAIAPLLVVPLILTGKQRSGITVESFESGQVPVGEPRRRYVMQYYPYLLIFVVFDVMAMFLFAWAVSFGALRLDRSVSVLLFLGVLLAPMIYGLKQAEKRELW
jgi:NADH-quinone oxidoreductase subunit A